MVFSKTYEQQIFVTLLCDFSGTKTIRKTINWIFLTFVKVVEVFRSSSSLNVKTQKAFHRRVSQRSVRCQPLLHRMEWWPPLNLRLTLTQSGKKQISIGFWWMTNHILETGAGVISQTRLQLSLFLFLPDSLSSVGSQKKKKQKKVACARHK